MLLASVPMTSVSDCECSCAQDIKRRTSRCTLEDRDHPDVVAPSATAIAKAVLALTKRRPRTLPLRHVRSDAIEEAHGEAEEKLMFVGVEQRVRCEPIKDPTRNGKDMGALRRHLDAPLVTWARNPRAAISLRWLTPTRRSCPPGRPGLPPALRAPD